MPFLQVIQLSLDPLLEVTKPGSIASQLWRLTKQYILREALAIIIEQTAPKALMFVGEVESEKPEAVVLLGEFPASKLPPQIFAYPAFMCWHGIIAGLLLLILMLLVVCWQSGRTSNARSHSPKLWGCA